MILRELVNVVGLDIKESDFDHAEKRFEGVKAAAEAFVGVLAASEVAHVANELVDLAAKANTTANVLGVIFGESLAEVNEWAETAAELLGRSRYQLEEYAKSLGSVLGPILKNEKATADMATGLSELAVDMSSFFGTTEEQALESLKSGIVGRTEGLKQYGIVIEDITMKEYAQAHGITTKLSQMSIQERTQLRYNFILDATAKMHGRVSKNTESYGNLSKTLHGRLEDLGTDIGKKLLPAATAFLSWLVKGVQFLQRWNKETKAGEFMVKAFTAALGLAAFLAGAYLLVNLGKLGKTLWDVARAFKLAGSEALISNLKMMAGGIALLLVLAAVYLIAEDIYTYLEGGDSLTGDILAKLKEPISKDDNTVVKWCKEGFQALDELGRKMGTWWGKKDAGGLSGEDKVKGVLDDIDTVGLWVDDLLLDAWDGVKKIVDGLPRIIRGTGSFWSETIDQWKAAVTGFFGWLTEDSFLTWAPRNTARILVGIGEAIIETVPKIIYRLKEALGGILGVLGADLADMFKLDWAPILDRWRIILGGFFKWIKEEFAKSMMPMLGAPAQEGAMAGTSGSPPAEPSFLASVIGLPWDDMLRTGAPGLPGSPGLPGAPGLPGVPWLPATAKASAAASSSYYGGSQSTINAPVTNSYTIVQQPGENAKDFVDRSMKEFDQRMQGILAAARAATTPKLAGAH